MAVLPQESGITYDVVYKNMMREIRQYLRDDFKRYCFQDLGQPYRRNPQIKYHLFPFKLLLYVIDRFESHTYEAF